MRLVDVGRDDRVGTEPLDHGLQIGRDVLPALRHSLAEGPRVRHGIDAGASRHRLGAVPIPAPHRRGDPVGVAERDHVGGREAQAGCRGEALLMPDLAELEVRGFVGRAAADACGGVAVGIAGRDDDDLDLCTLGDQVVDRPAGRERLVVGVRRDHEDTAAEVSCAHRGPGAHGGSAYGCDRGPGHGHAEDGEDGDHEDVERCSAPDHGRESPSRSADECRDYSLRRMALAGTSGKGTSHLGGGGSCTSRAGKLRRGSRGEDGAPRPSRSMLARAVPHRARCWRIVCLHEAGGCAVPLPEPGRFRAASIT